MTVQQVVTVRLLPMDKEKDQHNCFLENHFGNQIGILRQSSDLWSENEWIHSDQVLEFIRIFGINYSYSNAIPINVGCEKNFLKFHIDLRTEYGLNSHLFQFNSHLPFM